MKPATMKPVPAFFGAGVFTSCLLLGLIFQSVLNAGLTPVSKEVSGAPEHPIPWSFRAIAAPVPPGLNDDPWISNPIDAFILDGLRHHRLPIPSRATPLALLRRAYFDLIGLPPPPDVVEAFTRDRQPHAYARLIERLLASRQYGERWGRHWLDVVRYADTGGFENDYLYPSAWKYRDYVIRSLNANKPFDRFIEEQVSGDELWPGDADATTATDLYCVGPALEESAMTSNLLEYEWLQDSADTTGAAFLGLTIGCARCHDHKYDPISQKDYYSFEAIFGASDRPFPANVRIYRLKGLNGLLSDGPLPPQYLNDPRCTVETEDMTGFHLFHRAEPMQVHRLYRGQVSTPREVVAPAAPAALTQKSETAFSTAPAGRRRAALARWLTSPRNPLTARVLVNRVWAWHFGQGLVRTPNDFGNQGELATHPELLDWLARDFMSHRWDLKRLHRQIMLSSAYCMASVAQGPGEQVDPENRFLWHFPRHRLEGEAIRDSMLADSGELNGKQFGPAIVPPLGAGELAGLFNPGAKWPATKDPSQYHRRSIYVLDRRTFVLPLFAAFDAPELMTSCPVRFQTIVPTQALTLMNSPLAREQSRAMARRLTKECGNDDGKIAARAFLLAFSRPIDAPETERATTFLKERAAALRASSEKTKVPAEGKDASPRQEAVAELCLALFNANEFVFVD
jgi:hypothetical protein